MLSTDHKKGECVLAALAHEDCINTIYISELTEKVKHQGDLIRSLQNEIGSLRESTSVDREKISQIYLTLSEIKMSINDLTLELKKLQTKPDSFKNASLTIFVDLLKLAIIGGLFYYLSGMR
jgi:septal ring factor EnvC (AmiA/AmiB activator)